MTLLQPAVTSEGVELPQVAYQVQARLLSDPGGSVHLVDGVRAEVRVQRYAVLYPPEGVGSRWQALIDGVTWNIENAQYLRGRPLLHLHVRATRLSGKVQVV